MCVSTVLASSQTQGNGTLFVPRTRRLSEQRLHDLTTVVWSVKLIFYAIIDVNLRALEELHVNMKTKS